MSQEKSKKGDDTPDSQKKAESRRNFLKLAGVGVAGIAVGAVVEYPILNNEVQNANNQLQTANQQISTLNTQLQQDNAEIATLQAQASQNTAFITLSLKEQSLVEALVETIIPSDQSGPGAKEAGVIYFIDRQLATDYGKSANMYMKGPFIAAGTKGPITLDGINYSDGTPSMGFPGGQKYQYSSELREFWRFGLDALQKYSNSAYSQNFEKLSASQQVQVLTDLYNNKPNDFNDIVPLDFFNELLFMTWSGFFMDPMYGGNRGLVGWKLTGFNGANMGNFYGEGLQVTDLMVADKPTRLQPASLGQYQQKISSGGT